MAHDTEELIRHEWIYAGQRTDHKGKLYYEWRDTAEPLDKEGSAMWYGKSFSTPTPPIGAVFAVHTVRAPVVGDGDGNDSGRVRTGGEGAPTYLRMERDVDLQPWIVEDRIARTMKEAKARVRKAKKEEADLGTMTLAEVRKEWQHQRSRIRGNGLLAAVIGYITSTRVSDAEGD